VPDITAASAFGVKGAQSHVAIARLENIDVLLPVREDATTAIAYHVVDNPGTVPFTPIGELVSGGGITGQLADAVDGGGGVEYHLMDGDSAAGTAGLDVGAVPGSLIRSPVEGQITNIKDYKLYGEFVDYEIDITLAANPSVMLVITHVAAPMVAVGDPVIAGETRLGKVRAFPSEIEQSLKAYTSDAGDHVEMLALRIQPKLDGI